MVPELYTDLLTGKSKWLEFYRVNKAGRAAGVLENHEEGRRYAMHGLRSFVHEKTPEIMPAINKFFTEPK